MNDTTASTRAAAERLAAFYEQLTPSMLPRLSELYAPDAHFRDPFNDVHGIDAIREIFERMYAKIVDCRFRIVDAVVDGRAAMLGWEMQFRFRRDGRLQRIRGVSHVAFDIAGRVTDHRDYWDAAGELYEKLPVVGALMRWLRRRVG